MSRYLVASAAIVNIVINKSVKIIIILAKLEHLGLVSLLLIYIKQSILGL